MRAVVQRVKSAKVVVDNTVVGSIDRGLLVLLGVHKEDATEQVHWCADKVANLRIFSDTHDKMNMSVKELGFEVLVVSQFTLYGNITHGRRPDFLDAADPIFAEEMYQEFIRKLTEKHEISVQQGSFGQKRQVELINDGPVTIFIETPNKAN